MKSLSKFLLFASIFMLLAVACKDDDNNSEDPALAELRINIATFTADNMISTAFDDFNLELDLLDDSVDLFSRQIGTDELAAMRTQLLSAWESWQYASIYSYGPATDIALERIINTYPADDEKIETNITEEVFELNNLSNFDATGFPSLDYLLNAFDDATTIEQFQSDPNRVEYLNSIVSIMQSSTATVVNDFNSGEFINNFKSSTSSGTDVGSALGIIMNSVDIHFQRSLRDGKVAIPSGVRTSGVVRPTTTEALYAGQSKGLLIASLQAYRDLFNGTDRNNISGASIYDYLIEIGQEQIVEDAKSLLTESISLANDLEDDFTFQIESDNQKLVDLFLQLQDFVTLVKSDMVSVMGITLTNQDNDGD